MSTDCEDKKCRICGFADIKNVNIFNSANWKTLLTKILTVYPIVVYCNDPLPKNICKKCIYNVSFMYNDIQRVMKIQSKWIGNVRRIEPNHSYVRILDLIQNSNNVTRESIKSAFDVDIYKLSERILTKTDTEEHAAKLKMYKPLMTKRSSTLHKPPIKAVEKSSHIKEIKSILELNGCSLLAMNSAKTPKPSESKASISENVTAANVTHDDNSTPAVVKLESPELVDNITKEQREHIDDSSQERNIALLSCTTSKSSANQEHTLVLESATKFPCNYCPVEMQSLSTLATHQLQHLRLHIPRIFEKRRLRKSDRRGRLISVQNRKCIRCLNCWRIFVDNKSILDHWSQAECDFYCHVCGKDYAQAPKMLREHVPAAHGISYRSSKQRRVNLLDRVLSSMQKTAPEQNADYKLYQAVSEQEPLPNEADTCSTTISEPSTSSIMPPPPLQSFMSTTPPKKKKKMRTPVNSDGSVSCPKCHLNFVNMKARNSHMRKHKPSYIYGDTVLPLNRSGHDAYVKGDEPESDIDSTLPATDGSTAVRGVRTKFVKRRAELTPNVNIRIKSISELQSSTATTQPSNNCFNIAVWLPQLTKGVQVKEEPIDVDSL